MAATLPDAAYLRQCLRFDPATGYLWWLERPEWMFRSRTSWKAWNARFSGRRAFTAQNNSGYHVGGINGAMYFAHRVGWKLVYGEDPAAIDHIDGNPANNKLSNLRACSRSVNSRNARQHRHNQSGITGVYFNKGAEKWFAQMRVKEFSKSKSFATLQEAASWRRALQRQLGFTERHGRAA